MQTIGSGIAHVAESLQNIHDERLKQEERERKNMLSEMRYEQKRQRQIARIRNKTIRTAAEARREELMSRQESIDNMFAAEQQKLYDNYISSIAAAERSQYQEYMQKINEEFDNFKIGGV